MKTQFVLVAFAALIFSAQCGDPCTADQCDSSMPFSDIVNGETLCCDGVKYSGQSVIYSVSTGLGTCECVARQNACTADQCNSPNPLSDIVNGETLCCDTTYFKTQQVIISVDSSVPDTCECVPI